MTAMKKILNYNDLDEIAGGRMFTSWAQAGDSAVDIDTKIRQ